MSLQDPSIQQRNTACHYECNDTLLRPMQEVLIQATGPCSFVTPFALRYMRPHFACANNPIFGRTTSRPRVWQRSPGNDLYHSPKYRFRSLIPLIFSVLVRSLPAESHRTLKGKERGRNASPSRVPSYAADLSARKASASAMVKSHSGAVAVRSRYAQNLACFHLYPFRPPWPGSLL